MKRAEVEQLYRTHGPSVLRRARAILGEEAAARDALQEVFVRLIRGGDELRGEASPMTWLYRVTTNYCLNWIRDRARRAELLQKNAPTGEPEAPSPEGRALVVQLLLAAPAELREVAIYYYVDEMSHDEIAALTGVSRRTVGNRLEAFRAAVGGAPAQREAR